ncbi:MAG: hypothetical protein OPY03_00740 [Nitrosopumilus sp.]|nr:hypothetical protein [Nitrosopumilus sp.]MDF2429101.1 hypothetical protein [Nitrosopumilus sp.]
MFETKYSIHGNSKRETLTVRINAENKNSIPSKILQAFALDCIPTSGGPWNKRLNGLKKIKNHCYTVLHWQ